VVVCPLTYLADVSRRTSGKATVLVAMLIYRRVHVCKNRTVTLSSAELDELGVNRPAKCKALARLAGAGIIRIEDSKLGRLTKVTLLWRAGQLFPGGNNNVSWGKR
jgi:hypothetical protein